MFILIENGDIHDPAPRGAGSILVANDRIERVGNVDRRALDALGVEYEAIDAAGCVVAPGIIDPHEHLLGGSGEGSLALQTPMIFPREIVRAGVTTVVGTLGVDTTMKTIEGLLARVKAMHEEGLSAFMWTGGYNVPPTTVLGSVREDMLFIHEVVGAGEVAIADERGLNQSAQELAKLVRDTHVGGLLSGKAGVTHFHVGEEEVRLRPLRELIDDFQVKPEWLYPTHVQRNEKLLGEAIALAKRGATVDFDCVEQDVARWLRFYLAHDGPPERLTVSSDADSSTPDILFQQLRGLVLDHRHPLELVLRLVTANPARVLELKRKGRLAEGCDADVLVLDRDSLEIREVIARGHRMVVDGQLVLRERYLSKSSRAIAIVGDQAPEEAVERASREAPDAGVTDTLGGARRS
ncbi:MAG: beta-aspartyl-peptidase [Gemmatimonadaceae bacterium]|nr:beta-aspartyl-peptidase [Gemmatimonadaceae bacterium]NUQ91595.1 beta-aspartyl-peptidase [Gemmatimonadaceae bacterium]NUR18722.1 beta-aspartyl-peptidase [Gemmatimonadaceae bacterium]NUS98108.1 beta-aspartyl-peptidase [Gemmatimonadaceae bacterium]